MKIYSKTGDDGSTGLVGAARVGKDDLVIATIGAIDELNAMIGLALKANPPKREVLERAQNLLFAIGAEVASIHSDKPHPSVSDAHTHELEVSIDAMTGELPPLANFVLPGGCEASARLHLCRTAARSAERNLVALHRSHPQRGELLRYLNRLSDWMFVAARYANHVAGVGDVIWNQNP